MSLTNFGTNLNNILTLGQSGEADRALQQQLALYQGLKPPTAEEMRYDPQMLQWLQNYDPRMLELFLQGETQMRGVSTDPRLMQAQYDALNQLQEIGQAGGLTAMDRAALNQISQEQNREARGAREAILQQAQARGAGGSGMEILAQLQAQQDAAQRASSRGFNVAGQAQERALQALQQAGGLGGQMQQTQFGQQAQIAQAQDAINRFNTQQRTQSNAGNVTAANQGQMFNLQGRQNIANANTGLQNESALRQANIPQQQFQNTLGITGLQGQGLQTQAAQAQAQGQGNRQLIGGIIQSAGQLGAAALSDKNLKEDIERFDAGDFLDSLTGYKYKYKDEKHGKGPQVGVMAQDVEKHAPNLVEETEEGKILNYNKAGGPIFASLADLHQRLRELEGSK